MKKFLSIVLTTSMVATSVVPTYASTTDANAKKVFFETAQNTITQINDEMYDAKTLANYESTMTTFLTNLVETNKLTASTNTTLNFDGENQNMNVDYTYNDDGKSIMITYSINGVQFGEKMTSTGTFYLDDTKIVLKSADIADQPIVYNFGESLGDPNIDPYINYLKYSNIKKYFNLLLELETSGKLDLIVKDYTKNLLIYVAEADFTYENNTVTLVIDDELIEEYLYQLVDKIKNDKNIKAIYDSLDLPFSYSELFNNELATELDAAVDEMFTDSGDDFKITYTGVIQNDVFTQNKVEFSAPETEDTLIFDFNFNDVANGVLSNADFSVYDSEEFLDITGTYSFVDNKGEKTFIYEVKSEDEVFSKGNYKYNINGLSQVSSGEIVTYSQPFYFITKEPTKEILTKEEWLANNVDAYNSMITDLNTELTFAKEQIDKLNKASGTAYLDVNNDLAYSFYTFASYGYDSDYVVEEVINLEDGKVLNKDGVLELLNLWAKDVNSSIEFYNTSLEESKLFVDEQYAEYLEINEENYKQDLQDYNEYLTYIANGRPLNTIRQTLYNEAVLSNEKLTGKQNQEVYQNNKLQTKSFVEYVLEKSKTKNIVDTSNAISAKEFMN